MKEELQRKIRGIEEEATNLRRLRNRIFHYARSWEAVKSEVTTYAVLKNKDVAESMKDLENAYETTGDKDIAEAIKSIDSGLGHLHTAKFKLDNCLRNIEEKIRAKKSGEAKLE